MSTYCYPNEYWFMPVVVQVCVLTHSLFTLTTPDQSFIHFIPPRTFKIKYELIFTTTVTPESWEFLII